MIQLVLESKQTVDKAQHAGQTALTPKQIVTFEERYQALITEGYEANPPADRGSFPGWGKAKQGPARNLLNRLSRHQRAVLAFMYDFQVPFDNN